jgi:hypothetical protein
MTDPTPEIGKSDSPTDLYSTVKFNVGGCHYDVSRPLIEKFPSTMLARMVSETWQKDREATLFIERNGERFQYCLDYMRDGEVWLPLNAPKQGVLLDLDYFGFEEEVYTTKIHGGTSNLAAGRHLAKCKEEHDKVVSTCMENVKTAERNVTTAEMICKENIKSAETTRKCEEVAYDCFLRFSRGNSLTMMGFSGTSEIYSSGKVAIANLAEFQDYLAKYGLALVSAEFVDSYSNRYDITLKEKEDTIN